jgi:hypothetical protein
VWSRGEEREYRREREIEREERDQTTFFVYTHVYSAALLLRGQDVVRADLRERRVAAPDDVIDD